jgi:hypothetical protein
MDRGLVAVPVAGLGDQEAGLDQPKTYVSSLMCAKIDLWVIGEYTIGAIAGAYCPASANQGSI